MRRIDGVLRGKEDKLKTCFKKFSNLFFRFGRRTEGN